jgi:glutamate/tyrosine decarboxylase-like PLP-dependent enzyme
LENLVTVKTDDRGKMIPSELDAAIEKTKADGRTPFFVNSTAGTTVLGAFDDFEAIADVCEKHGVWLHIDVSIL